MPQEYNFGGYNLNRMFPSASITTPTLYSKMISTIASVGEPKFPHHPLQCVEWENVELDDNGMRCKHKSVDILDEKLQAAINFSITELIMELVREKYGDR